MTRFAIKVPDVGEGVAEAELVEWMVEPGDEVAEDQIVAAVMTDKATIEIPSSVPGRVISLGAGTGDRIAVGSELLLLEVEDAAQAAAEPPVSSAGASSPVAHPAAPRSSRSAGHVLAAPAVRKRARDLGIDLGAIAGSGPEGRVLHRDLDQVLQVSGGQMKPAAAEAAIAPGETRVVGLRRLIAERMSQAVREAAHFSYVEEVDVEQLEDMRATMNVDRDPQSPALSPLPFVVRAIVLALRDFPQMNAHFDGGAGTVRRHEPVHMGIATQTADGLMVPVVRDAEQMSVAGLAAAIVDIAARARRGALLRNELSGSTVTVTSLGALGGVATTPILNLPEVAIVGVNRIAVRPAWTGRAFVPHRMMNLSSSFDHRVIDGQEAAQFVQRIRELLQSPGRMLAHKS